MYCSLLLLTLSCRVVRNVCAESPSLHGRLVRSLNEKKFVNSSTVSDSIASETSSSSSFMPATLSSMSDSFSQAASGSLQPDSSLILSRTTTDPQQLDGPAVSGPSRSAINTLLSAVADSPLQNLSSDNNLGTQKVISSYAARTSTSIIGTAHSLTSNTPTIPKSTRRPTSRNSTTPTAKSIRKPQSPQFTHSPNHTAVMPSNASCANCNYIGVESSTLLWTPLCLMATLTAHTIVHIVNNRTNTTQTITRSVNLPDFDEPVVFVTGTQNATPRTTVILSRGLSSAVTTVIRYPHTLIDYPDHYEVEGQDIDALLQNIKPNATCGDDETSSTFYFPSHPTLLAADQDSTLNEDVEVNSMGDVNVRCRQIVIGETTIQPTGTPLTVMVPVWSTGNVPLDFYQSAFPDQLAFKVCTTKNVRPVNVITYLQAVQLLTETSTSYATGTGSFTQHAQPKATSTSDNNAPVGLDSSQDLTPSTAVSTPGTIPSPAGAAPTTSMTPMAGLLGAVASSMVSGITASLASQSTLSDYILTDSLHTKASDGLEATSAVKNADPVDQSPEASPQIVQLTIGTSAIALTPISLQVSMAPTTASDAVPAFVIGSQTIGVGIESAATIDGTRVVLQTSGEMTLVVIGVGAQGSTVRLSTPTITPPPIVVGGTTVPPSLPSTALTFVVSGHTLTPGGFVTVSNSRSMATVALKTDSAGNAVLIDNDTTTTLVAGPQTTPIIIAGQTLTPILQPPTSLSGFVVSGQTLTIGGSVTLHNGSSVNTFTLTTDSLSQTILINSDGTISTLLLPSPPSAPIIVDGTTFSPIPSTKTTTPIFEYHISNQILTLGGTITLGSDPSKTVLALTTDSSGRIILLQNGKPSTTLTSAPTKTNAPLIIGGTTFFPLLATGKPVYDVDGTTLTLGGSITMTKGRVLTLTTNDDGKTVLKSNGGVSTVGVERVWPNATTTARVTNITTTNGDPLATAVMSGMGVVPTGSTSVRVSGSGAASFMLWRWRFQWSHAFLNVGILGWLSVSL